MRCAPLMLQLSPHLELDCLGWRRQFMEAHLEYWFSRWFSRVARFSICVSLALMLYMLLAWLTFMSLYRLVSEETLLTVMVFTVPVLVALALIASAIATESFWRWIGARRENR